MFEELCKFLSKNSFPVKESEPLNVRHILSLKCLLGTVRCICERIQNTQQEDIKDARIDKLIESKNIKKKYIAAAEIFNQNYKKGISYLQGKYYYYTTNLN